MKFSVFFSTLLLIILSFNSCGEVKEDASTVQKVIQDSTFLYGNNRFVFPELSEKAKEEISQWSVYEDFEIEAKSLGRNTIEVLRSKTERLLAHTDSLIKTIPEGLNTKPIFSRFVVVKTRLGLLHQEVHQSRIDSIQLQKNVDEANISIKNFIVQINEKFQKQDIDLQRKEDEEKELEKQKRFLDSVYKIELQDKKNKSV